jgi:hypothetical protein
MGLAMRQALFFGSEEIVHPTCAKCGAPMWLTRIEPDQPGFESRLFECQVCNDQMMEIVQFRTAKKSNP